MAKMLPTFLFRVSRNCEIFAQISISCFAKFEGNFAKLEIENFAKNFPCLKLLPKLAALAVSPWSI